MRHVPGGAALRRRSDQLQLHCGTNAAADAADPCTYSHTDVVADAEPHAEPHATHTGTDAAHARAHARSNAAHAPPDTVAYPRCLPRCRATPAACTGRRRR